MLSVLFVASVTILCTSAYFDYSEDVYSRGLLREDDKIELNLKEIYFPQLYNFKIGGEEVTSKKYPWIAQVLHSRLKFAPYLCTAVCIEKRIFITAARCVYRMKVNFTSLLYNYKRLRVKAAVVPSIKSKQLYDDIGFIITHEKLNVEWYTIRTYDKPRPDENFNWFRDLKFVDFDHKVIAYAFSKVYNYIPIWYQIVDLVELDVVVDSRLCHNILNGSKNVSIFDVPCYHSCSLAFFPDKNDKCFDYVGVEGGALINKNTNILFGIATWGAYAPQYELPVGFSVPNSKSFYEDIKCARKIRENVESNTNGLYQRLCDNKRKYYEY